MSSFKYKSELPNQEFETDMSIRFFGHDVLFVFVLQVLIIVTTSTKLDRSMKASRVIPVQQLTPGYMQQLNSFYVIFHNEFQEQRQYNTPI
jgi:hypothetical protein